MEGKGKIKQRCNKMKLKYIEQCQTADCRETLEWKYLTQTTMQSIRGREPGWYEPLNKEIENKSTEQDGKKNS